jgi:hypothetical protein
MYFGFFLSFLLFISPPPTRHHGSVWPQPVMSLVLTNTVSLVGSRNVARIRSFLNTTKAFFESNMKIYVSEPDPATQNMSSET